MIPYLLNRKYIQHKTHYFNMYNKNISLHFYEELFICTIIQNVYSQITSVAMFCPDVHICILKLPYKQYISHFEQGSFLIYNSDINDLLTGFRYA